METATKIADFELNFSYTPSRFAECDAVSVQIARNGENVSPFTFGSWDVLSAYLETLLISAEGAEFLHADEGYDEALNASEFSTLVGVLSRRIALLVSYAIRNDLVAA